MSTTDERTADINDRATDRPLSDPLHDDFQRDVFAIRLAEELLAPAHTSSIVVGLYGKWGEGKSTVLNFIKQHLATMPEKVLVVSFNPWLFPDESQLLHNFFAQLAREIEGAEPEEEQPLAEGRVEKAKQWFEKNIKKTDKPLHTRKESLAKLASEYAGGISYAGVGLSKVLNAILPSPPNLEQLRKRIDEKIVASGKRVVIIIDDIDRLEKTQIQAVFRLVKLTANFRQTSYLLAFDDVMVARAIGEIFAAGADAPGSDALSAGQNFLEKIVQVPLRLPRARQQDLWRYCQARVQEALAGTKTELDSEEARRAEKAINAQRFESSLLRGIMPRLTTPRLAIRYANAIRFSLPLLRGEVNTVDLLLVEALNIFYPELHQFIASRQDGFAGSSEKRQVVVLQGNSDEPDTNIQLGNILQIFNYSGESAAGAKALLTALFPRLTDTSNPWEDANNVATEAELNRRQSVAAPVYFSRYFSYSVAHGDVSDQEFNSFLQIADSEQLARFTDLAQRLGVDITLQRIEYRQPDLTVDQSRTLFATLLQAADLYQPDLNWSMFGNSEVAQVVGLLIQLLMKLPETERAQLASQLIREGGSFKLAYEFDQQLQLRFNLEKKTGHFGQPSNLPPMLAPEAWDTLLSTTPQLLLERALREANGAPLYHTHPERAYKLLVFIWPQLAVPPGPVDYLFSFLDQNPAEVNDFLEVCSQRASSGNGPYHWVGFDPKMFDRLREVFGERLYNLVRAKFGNEIVKGVDFNDFDTPTQRQRLQQFIWLYENRPLPDTPVQ
jgi:predicted KAP-like P-loop ATPase